MTIFELERQLRVDTHRFYPTQSKYVLYFLLQENEIVYIGKSDTKNYLGRIRSHKKNKQFDCYHVMPLDMNERDALSFETGLISSIRPIYNKRDCFVQLNAISYAMQLFDKSRLPIVVNPIPKKKASLFFKLTAILVPMLFVTSIFGFKGVYLFFTWWLDGGTIVDLLGAGMLFYFSIGFLWGSFKLAPSIKYALNIDSVAGDFDVSHWEQN